MRWVSLVIFVAWDTKSSCPSINAASAGLIESKKCRPLSSPVIFFADLISKTGSQFSRLPELFRLLGTIASLSRSTKRR
jgi:hypothetical protein